MSVLESVPDPVPLVATVLDAGPDSERHARTLLDRFGRLSALFCAAEGDLREAGALQPEQARRLHAALQLSRLSLRAPSEDAPVVTPEQAARWFVPRLGHLQDEELHALFVDRARRPLRYVPLTRGSDRFTVVDPRQIFRQGLLVHAAGVLLAHNHPSGELTPSHQDRAVTRRVHQAGTLLGIPLLDHLVIAGQEHRSMARLGLLPSSPSTVEEWTR